tara:strand:- start:8467 stop:8757 length:291 start_codon:yes stop_codon:yes gene_type:complete
MEPQAKHEQEPWHRHCDDESRNLRFHQQPLRVFLFPTFFFSCSSPKGVEDVSNPLPRVITHRCVLLRDIVRRLFKWWLCATLFVTWRLSKRTGMFA